MKTIQMPGRLPPRHSAWNTAYCMVKLDDTRIRVKTPARRVSRSVPAGGHGPTVLARMVKKAAKRPLKNISSDPSQIMTPTASMGGRSWTIFPWARGPPPKQPGSQRIF